MNGSTFINLKAIRKELDLSQTELASLIGVSERTIQSCEQGWRNPGQAVEKAAVLLLLARRHGPVLDEHQCWVSINCSDEERSNCLVYQSHQGHLCWLLSGNLCRGRSLKTWRDKKENCFECPFFSELLPGGVPMLTTDA
ncbi:helix-turn-helix domain-containing protein [Candidatus Zixiibacteriota bacterium]